jgi:transposase-like protein
MNPKESLLREMFAKVGDTVSEQTISEKINQFMKYGNVFLFFEIMNLRKEIERLKDELTLPHKTSI